jgi:predicted lipoprotein
MVSSLPLDTHETVKKLRKAGFSEKQAEAQTEIIATLVQDQLVTKNYLDEKLRDLEYRLILRLGGMMAVTAGIIVGILKLIR